MYRSEPQRRRKLFLKSLVNLRDLKAHAALARYYDITSNGLLKIGIKAARIERLTIETRVGKSAEIKTFIQQADTKLVL